MCVSLIGWQLFQSLTEQQRAKWAEIQETAVPKASAEETPPPQWTDPKK